jgi:hypothetical protein
VWGERATALMGGAHCAEGEGGTRDGKRRRQLGPTGQRERESGCTRVKGTTQIGGSHHVAREGVGARSWAES